MRPTVDIRLIEPRGGLHAQELDLRFRVLRKPLGHSFDDVKFPFDDESLHFVAVQDDRVVGCVLFHPGSKRLFQMAVEPSLQRTGIGVALVRRLEDEVASRGFREVTLHARADAIAFYERLGYACEGEPYVEVGIPHRNMRKALSPPARSNF